ncbi:restriction endonuclease [Candidatus Viridilinea mediisalina]|uniref:Restriction endonuclease n=1 Tax=Candidatus Viridilinea mediisalina TaxID=2024553 RepID=A0A2A6RHA3_9CHLR|nr:restriction endonuclease [Candidatus Viridilinea mediisalina]PDW02504.1 restriction endonuclease [Candidatus Viridilinea mediisalina]
MEQREFEKLLDQVVANLNTELASHGIFTSAKEFEQRVRQIIISFVGTHGVEVDFSPHPHAFPDIAVGKFGVEVKFTLHNTWRSVANSIVESTRNNDIVFIYIVFGKMGGTPEVKWASYDESVIHVRTTHVPRFEVEINPKRSLFKEMGITYKVFSQLSVEEKMKYIRRYARSRLKPGERLWWLEDQPEPEHSLPLEVRLYTSLSHEEKRRLRAEAAILSPKVVSPSRTRNKYDDAVLYILTYHGVICHQARDLFSAGSVALRSNEERGGIYIQRALQDIEHEMYDAAMRLEDALFVEYWGSTYHPRERIKVWLCMADIHAQGWVPSEVLFRKV